LYLEKPQWRGKLAFLFGVVVAMGMCAKHLYPIYVVLPLAWLLVLMLRESDWQPRKFLWAQAVLLLALIAGVGLGLAYIVVLNYDGFVDGIMRSFFIQKSALASINYVPPTVSERIWSFQDYQLESSKPYLVLLLLGGLAGCFFWSARLTFVWLWLAGSFGVLLFILAPTQPYYFHAAMPAVALIMSAAVSVPPRFRSNRPVRLLMMGIATAIGLSSVHSHLQKSLAASSLIRLLATARRRSCCAQIRHRKFLIGE
jgi:hypothetical protein